MTNAASKSLDCVINSNSNTNSQHLSMDLESEVKLLRDRLHRRNIILDTIRKSYHRDVVLVRNLILPKHVGDRNFEEIVHSDLPVSFFPSSEMREDYLRAVPSIDLRSVLPLFAPNECGLRIKPCHTCGGQVEIVHNESQSIFDLKEECAMLRSKKRDLLLQSSRAIQQAKIDRARLQAVKESLQKAEQRFLRDLKIREIKITELKENSDHLNFRIVTLEQDKERTMKSLNELHQIRIKMANVQSLYNDTTDKLKMKEKGIHMLEQKQMESSNVEKTLRESIDQLENNGHLLAKENHGLKDELSKKKNDFDNLLNEKKRLDGIVNSQKLENLKLKSDLTKSIKAHDISLSTMKQENKKMIDELRSDLRMREKENKTYEKKIGDALKEIKKRENELLAQIKKHKEKEISANHDMELAPQSSNNKKVVNDETDKLLQHTVLCAKELYARCIAQEKHLDERFKIDITEVEYEVSSESQHLNEVMQNLNISKDVDLSNWNKYFEEESCRSKILLYLQKRNIDGFNLLESMYSQKLSRKDSLIHKLKEDASKDLRDLKRSCDDKIRLHKKKVKEAAEKRDGIEKEMRLKTNECKEAKVQVTDMGKKIVELEENLFVERDNKKRVERENCEIRNKIEELEKKTSVLDADALYFQTQIASLTREIEEKNNEIPRLKRDLNCTLAKYENIIEKEKERLYTNKNKGIQYKPNDADKSFQVEFISLKQKEGSISNAKNLLLGKTNESKNIGGRYYPVHKQRF